LVAHPERRHPANVAGPWFVDDTCIDCDACRQLAPALFGDHGDQSVVMRQPQGAAEVIAATRALLACPTGSIGTRGPRAPSSELFPHELAGGVFYCGYNSSDSYGANAFFAQRPDGNLLIDSPRFVGALERRFQAMGGIAHILLTHQDDVADAGRWADRFGARVWIHEQERHAAPFATGILYGEDATEIRPGLRAIPVPGHTRGSVVFLLEDRFLFSGDSLHYDRAEQRLSAFRRQCWYSWSAQRASLARLLDERFEWVLAGHGDRLQAEPAEIKRQLAALVARM
jgi:glyoxylase-like metal-dependent hydrolase (beta-lactamase superfamily II)/ferredoxin